MSITSVWYLLFLIIAIIVYYAFPRRFQHVILMIISILFFGLTSGWLVGLYTLAAIVITYLSANGMQKSRKEENIKRVKQWFALGLTVDLGMLALLKYGNFFILNFNKVVGVIGASIPRLDLLAPLGISFYTFAAVGYLLDVYWGVIEEKSSLLNTGLLIGYFPLLTSGPIIKYDEAKDSLFKTHNFEFKNLEYGFVRIMWGFFKKLVISTRAGIIVDAIYADAATYDGFYIWVAMFLFMIQLYTDFSGCMDIIMGTSECLGVSLPENFRTPFFSQSVQEYWQRWHITLGRWMRDYVMYSITRAKLMRKLTKCLKQRVSKKMATKIVTYVAMLCVWLLIGLWHGGKWRYILGEGLWFFFVILIAQITEPLWIKLNEKLKINTACFSWKLLRAIGVYILVSIGNIFFRIDGLGLSVWTFKQGFASWNPEILFDESLYALGIDGKNFRVMLIGILILIFVSAFQEKKGSVRDWLYKQNTLFKWIFMLLFIFSVILFGVYGPGYDAQSFIYQAF